MSRTFRLDHLRPGVVSFPAATVLCFDVTRLGKRLDVSSAAALGHLASLWCTAVRYVDADGVFVRPFKWDAWDVAISADWHGDGDAFVDALEHTGWLDVVDGRFRLLRWATYGGGEQLRRQAQRDRSSLRKGMSPRLRFEVLKRDNFTCRYCGASAPDVRLHVDHVVAVVNGGKTEPSNLVTACEPCNVGKSDVPLETT